MLEIQIEDYRGQIAELKRQNENTISALNFSQSTENKMESSYDFQQKQKSETEMHQLRQSLEENKKKYSKELQDLQSRLQDTEFKAKVTETDHQKELIAIQDALTQSETQRASLLELNKKMEKQIQTTFKEAEERSKKKVFL